MKQMEFSILGQVYVLGCPEGGEALLAKAVAAVDREMAGIRDAGKVRARERIAVLAALNLAYQLAEQAPQPEAAATPRADATLSQQQVDALVQRLDHALGADGQLL
ncbi:MAG: cell division protein ZapA [Rubrivivax sp.]